MAGVDLTELTCQLLAVAEKSAQIARAIRSEDTLFNLLIEEKTGAASNKRFVHDFKTLADVLVQETVRYYLAEKFPGLSDYVYGEESNEFTNANGDHVTLSIQSNPEDTKQLLNRVLCGNETAASLLTQLVHSPCPQPSAELLQKLLPASNMKVPLQDIAVWIDPIDCTSQYIVCGATPSDVIEESESVEQTTGLQCVVVLVGIFSRHTGLPIAGVVNQPFADLSASNQRWEGRACWGLCYENLRLYDVPQLATAENQPRNGDQKTVMLSISEAKDIQTRLRAQGFNLHFAAGAGYKMLCVSDYSADAYLVSNGTTFKWDTCAPNAILRAMGGGVACLEKLRLDKSLHDSKTCLSTPHNKIDNPCNRDENSSILSSLNKPESQIQTVQNSPLNMAAPDVTEIEAMTSQLEKAQVVYNRPDKEEGHYKEGQKWSNSSGILVYRDQKLAAKISHVLA